MGNDPPPQQPPPPPPGQQPPGQPPGAPPGPGGTVTAEWWKRLVAYIIDVVIVSIPSYIVMAIFSVGMVSTAPTLEMDPVTGQVVQTGGGGFVGFFAGFLVAMLIIFVLGVAYFVYFHGSRGQTVGKMAMSIKVVKEDTGQLISYGEAFLRWLIAAVLWVVCYIPGIVDGLWPLWDDKRQALHDKVVKSLVIDA